MINRLAHGSSNCVLACSSGFVDFIKYRSFECFAMIQFQCAYARTNKAKHKAVAADLRLRLSCTRHNAILDDDVREQRQIMCASMQIRSCYPMMSLFARDML